MGYILSFILGGIVVAYWRDKKFRDWVNLKVFKKSQHEKKLDSKTDVHDDDKTRPVI